MLPPHVPPESADRNTLWNSAEAQEEQWNSQLARRFVLAIHDKGDGNPHAHIPLTTRAMDEKDKWLPKRRKVYGLNEKGERIRLPSGRWKCHKENTVDRNDQKYAEIWQS